VAVRKSIGDYCIRADMEGTRISSLSGQSCDKDCSNVAVKEVTPEKEELEEREDDNTNPAQIDGTPAKEALETGDDDNTPSARGITEEEEVRGRKRGGCQKMNSADKLTSLILLILQLDMAWLTHNDIGDAEGEAEEILDVEDSDDDNEVRHDGFPVLLDKQQQRQIRQMRDSEKENTVRLAVAASGQSLRKMLTRLLDSKPRCKLMLWRSWK
jgi:hypothetical protein